MEALRIDGLFNVRASAPKAPWIIRSGATETLTPAGAASLRRLDVTAILDLREQGESEAPQHGIPVRSVPLYGTRPPEIGRLEEIYESLLRERGHALSEAVGVIADSAGAVLVHCTAGKDRTGLVVALARLAAGESTAAVIEDYSLSGPHVHGVRSEHAHRVAEEAADAERAEILRLHLDSPPEAITHALAVIDEFGGAAEYLLAHGLSDQQLNALRRKGQVDR